MHLNLHENIKMNQWSSRENQRVSKILDIIHDVANILEKTKVNIYSMQNTKIYFHKLYVKRTEELKTA